jgi:hypothetical protein
LRRISFLLVLVIAGFGVRTYAKHKGERRFDHRGEAPVSGFLPGDRDIIVDYFRTSRSALPPGLAKRNSLPRGLEKQLQRNGRLPPGLEKKLAPFPPELDARLAPIPAGYRRVSAGHIAIVWNPRTAVVIDFMHLD